MRPINRILASQNSVLVPDYNNPTIIAQEEASANHYAYQEIQRGNYLSKYFPSGHYWMAATSKTIPDIGEKYHTNSIYNEGENLKFIVPCSGYISCWAFQLYGYAKEIPSDYDFVGFTVRIVSVHGDRITLCNLKTSKNEVKDYGTTLTPVKKGDKVYYGTPFDTYAPPSNYGIIFYPGVSVDAKTGD